MPDDAKPKSSVKETLTSIIIAFVLAFVFRAFVIEAFVIPTGSMAPTLMGAHEQIRSPRTGYTWAAGPAQHVNDDPNQPPLRKQSGTVHDLMLGSVRESTINFNDEYIRSGDRILVLKYLLGLFDPARFDVVVFKSPNAPQTNYIKRLIGLPGEQIALVDGDVFVRDEHAADDPDAPNAWAQPGWHIARKPERVQRAVWQDVYDSSYAPLDPVQDGRRYFSPPWLGDDWDLDGQSYHHAGATPTTLQWDVDRWPIRDRYPYDETSRYRQDDRFPVADLRLRAGIQPDEDLTHLAAVIQARGYDFRAQIDGDVATLAMRPASADAEWNVLATGDAHIPPGEVTNVEFWHVDQSLQLWVAGKRILHADYDWSPVQRVFNATGETLDDLLQERHPNILADERIYRRPNLHWEFAGSPVTLHRVAVQRDLYYQPAFYRSNPDGPIHARNEQPAAGTHPRQPVDLTDRQYFVCGDNSPASSDARLWDTPDPWVGLIDDTIGVVPRELMIGRAFMVYFPSPIRRFGLPIPDAGRLRLIW